MSEIAKECERNVKKYLEKERKAFYGMFMGLVRGGFCHVRTHERSYHIDYIVDEKFERFFIDVYPQIVCEKPYRHTMHSYVNAKTSKYKSGRIDIDSENGEVKVRVEACIVDFPVSVGDIYDMEHLAVNICDGIEKRLDRMAHGVYFEENDPDLMGVSEKRRHKRTAHLHDDDSDFGGSLDELIEMLKSGDDEDSDDIVAHIRGNGDNADDEDADGERTGGDDTEDSEEDEAADYSFENLFGSEEDTDDD